MQFNQKDDSLSKAYVGIKSIHIKNLLSFDELKVNNFEDINCIVGKNNTGKSNLLKLLRFFYHKLENKKELPPNLNSVNKHFGSITIVYNTQRIKDIITKQKKNKFFKHIYNELLKNNSTSTYTLTLKIYANDSVRWSIKNRKALKILNYLYPFFELETRNIKMNDWDKLWKIVSSLKSFDITNISKKEIVEFFNTKLSKNNNEFLKYIQEIEEITDTQAYNYNEKVLNFIQVALKGKKFLIDDKPFKYQSEGTSSHKYLQIALELLISLSRKDYITPIVFIDQPELGLHPKRNEELIYDLYKVYTTCKTNKEIHKCKIASPTLFISTHSSNIVKEIIKLFDTNQQVLYFSKEKNNNTNVEKMNSHYSDKRYLNIFSDNEARLFFSNYILFVEGETELEIFGNRKLINHFPILKQIDVYKSSSNVLGANINPNYLNISIPYLFLFDADKIYSFQNSQLSNSKIMRLENKNKKLYYLPDNKKRNEIIFDKLVEKYSKSSNKKHLKIVKNLKAIKKIQNIEFKYNKLSFKIENKNKFTKSIEQIEKYLNYYRIKFIHTTIEETLINNDNKKIFFAWLKNEYYIDINKYIHKNNKPRKYITSDIIIEYFRLLFGGKTELLIPYKYIIIKNNNNLRSRILLNYLHKDLPKQSKTNGWVTSFLNFAISKIENEIKKTKSTDSLNKEELFKKEFKKNFQELSEVIFAIKF